MVGMAVLPILLLACGAAAVSSSSSSTTCEAGVAAGGRHVDVLSERAKLLEQIEALRRRLQVLDGVEAPWDHGERNGSGLAPDPTPFVASGVLHEDEDVNPLIEWAKGYKTGPGVHRWSNYFEPYHRHFGRLRRRALRAKEGDEKLVVVEVGVQSGGSIRMWMDYFGGPERVRYIGVDVDPAVLQHQHLEGVEIVIGDQESREFWRQFREDHPGLVIDVFIDDGGHFQNQQKVTLEEMFWSMRDGGVFLVEDTVCSYWPGWGGGYKRPSTFVERVKDLLDSVHCYAVPEDQGMEKDEWCRGMTGVHVYGGMVFIDKGPNTGGEQVFLGDQWHSVDPERVVSFW